MPNTLFYGDNLDILRKHIPSESVDLVYLDPPFNSNRDYNVLFKDQSGESAQAQMKAFTDTWHWNPHAYADFEETCPNETLIRLMRGFVDTLGRNDVTAYLVMMAPRLMELHRVLKSTGSLYLHCDTTASAYLRLILDKAFDPKNFKNEIIWQRTNSHNDSRRFGRIHDVILFYSKTTKYTWNPQYTPYSQAYLDSEWKQAESGRFYKCENMLDPRSTMKEYKFEGTTARWRTSFEGMMALWNAPQTEVPESHGRIKLGKNGKPTKRCRIVFLDELPGKPLQSIWSDALSLRGGANERMGYPTQKPVALLERIINASSNPGDVVLDPFCGCGTAVIAAQTLGRQWMGIDITSLATTLIKTRLLDTFDLKEKADYAVVGEPTTAEDARALFERDAFEFQKWAVHLVPRAFPLEKKGADKGIDGTLRFRDNPHEDAKLCIIQVKGGKVSRPLAATFGHDMDREKATLGLFISLEPPTKPMRDEADSKGFYVTPLGGRRIEKMQFRTVEELLNGHAFDIPSQAELIGVKQAQRVKTEIQQHGLDL